ncbi:MAG: class I SAM-dependent methyltransferase [Polyangiaceae bacterium]|nr:class I SAM-dependent methyltransferase [Polyangiaceae bacterium]
MIDSPPCPACGETSWRPLGERTFRRGARVRSAYVRLRLRVLFEVWAPAAAEVTLRFVLCGRCGLVTYLPRASADEVDQKYRFLARIEPPRPERRAVRALDRRRSGELFHWAAAWLPAGGAVLDFGGGNGALLATFVEHGYRAGVVDYVPHAVPGVERLGSTLDEVPPEQRFDVVLASHVLEHLAAPVAVLERLRDRLAPGGVLVVEVPLEIVGGLPRFEEPVTHVSFFSEDSLSVALERAGLEVLQVGVEASTFESGARKLGVRAIARRGSGSARALPGAARALAWLSAGPLARVVRGAHARRIARWLQERARGR